MGSRHADIDILGDKITKLEKQEAPDATLAPQADTRTAGMTDIDYSNPRADAKRSSVRHRDPHQRTPGRAHPATAGRHPAWLMGGPNASMATSSGSN